MINVRENSFIWCRLKNTKAKTLLNKNSQILENEIILEHFENVKKCKKKTFPIYRIFFGIAKLLSYSIETIVYGSGGDFVRYRFMFATNSIRYRDKRHFALTLHD